MNHRCWKPSNGSLINSFWAPPPPLCYQNRTDGLLNHKIKQKPKKKKKRQTHQRHFCFSAHISSHFQAKYTHGSAVTGHTTPNQCRLPRCNHPGLLGIHQADCFAVTFDIDTSIQISVSIGIHRFINVYPSLPLLIILPISWNGSHMALWPQQGETVVPGCTKNTVHD